MDSHHMQQDIAQAAEYVLRRGFKRVTLQFPDYQLNDAPLVAEALARELAVVSDAQVYILADTTYNPLAIDEVAAEHVNADCVIHYGHASLSPVSRTPALCILPRRAVDVDQCSRAVADLLAQTNSSQSNGQPAGGAAEPSAAVLLYDQAYHHAWPALLEATRLAYQGPLQLIPALQSSLELDPPLAASGISSSSSVASKGLPNGSCAAPYAGAAAGKPCACGETVDSAAAQHPSSSTPPVQPPTAQVPGSGAHPDAGSQASVAAATSSSDDASLGSGSSGIAPTAALGGLTWQQLANAAPDRHVMLWIGPVSSPVLMALQMTHSSRPWLAYDPATGEVVEGVLPETARLLKRRYYLVEKARGASIIGILVGTLGAAGYKDALVRTRALARAAGKHTYTVLVGKPSPAKLGNFPEVEAFVMVADALGLILDSREYLAPLITPHEALLAFGRQGPLDPARYRLDFGELLAQPPQPRAAGTEDADGDGDGGGSGALSLPTRLALSQQGRQRQVAPRTAGEYLQLRRSYRGLETPATGADIKAPMLAVQGLAGRAAGYATEPATAAGGQAGVQEAHAQRTLPGGGLSDRA